MDLRAQRSAFRRISGASNMQMLLIVLIVLAALDLTRRFVALSLRFNEGERRPVAHAVVPEVVYVNAVVTSPAPSATTAMPVPAAPVVAAPVRPQVRSGAMPAPGVATSGNQPTDDMLLARMQKDYPLWTATTPVTFFSSWAVTFIGTPDDDSETNAPPTPQSQ